MRQPGASSVDTLAGILQMEECQGITHPTWPLPSRGLWAQADQESEIL